MVRCKHLPPLTLLRPSVLPSFSLTFLLLPHLLPLTSLFLLYPFPFHLRLYSSSGFQDPFGPLLLQLFASNSFRTVAGITAYACLSLVILISCHYSAPAQLDEHDPCRGNEPLVVTYEHPA